MLSLVPFLYSPLLYVPKIYDYDVIRVFAGTKQVEFGETKPVFRGKQLLIPLQEVVFALGGKVAFGPIRKHVVVTVGRKHVELSLTGGRSWVNGAPRILKSTPWISKGKVVVPLNFFVEGLGLTTVFDQLHNLARIVSREKAEANLKSG